MLEGESVMGAQSTYTYTLYVEFTWNWWIMKMMPKTFSLIIFSVSDQRPPRAVWNHWIRMRIQAVSESGSGSRQTFFYHNIFSKFTIWSTIVIYRSLFKLLQRTFRLQPYRELYKHEFFFIYFLFLACLDPQPIESGSNQIRTRKPRFPKMFPCSKSSCGEGGSEEVFRKQN